MTHFLLCPEVRHSHKDIKFFILLFNIIKYNILCYTFLRFFSIHTCMYIIPIDIRISFPQYLWLMLSQHHLSRFFFIDTISVSIKPTPNLVKTLILDISYPPTQTCTDSAEASVLQLSFFITYPCILTTFKNVLMTHSLTISVRWPRLSIDHFCLLTTSVSWPLWSYDQFCQATHFSQLTIFVSWC